MWIEKEQKYNEFVFQVEKDDTIKNVLVEQMGMSQRFITKLIKDPDIKLTIDNREKPKNNQIKKDQIVRIILPKETNNYIEDNEPLDIKYQDNDILVVNKPPYKVMHPTRKHQEKTLLNQIMHYFKENNIQTKVRLISRLDQDTSGLVVIALNPYSHYYYSKENKQYQKYYKAIVKGKLPKDQFTIREKIALADDGIKRKVSPEGKDSITKVQLIKQIGDYSLVKLKLLTGRTHQIRVHLSHIGCPIVGDPLYNNIQEANRQLLHCYKIKLTTPRENKTISIKAQLPADMEEFLKNINKQGE